MKIKYTEIKCPKCKREWQHRGTLLYAQCPNCKKTFKKEQGK